MRNRSFAYAFSLENDLAKEYGGSIRGEIRMAMGFSHRYNQASMIPGRGAAYLNIIYGSCIYVYNTANCIIAYIAATINIVYNTI